MFNFVCLLYFFFKSLKRAHRKEAVKPDEGSGSSAIVDYLGPSKLRDGSRKFILGECLDMQSVRLWCKCTRAIQPPRAMQTIFAGT
jgi:hypothetical protein